MKAHIVYAHPEPKSFNGALKDLAVRTLAEEGHSVTVADLYAMQFNPVGGKHDFVHRTNPDFFKYPAEQAAASRNGTFTVEIESEQKKLLDADFLLLQFPLWWFGLPAILKGWVDRVLAAGLTYGVGRWYSNGVFRGRRAMLSLTTGGPSNFYGRWGLDGDLDSLLYPISHGILHFVGFDVLPPFVAYAPDQASPEDRREVLANFHARLLCLQSSATIPYPALDSYDERFQLKPEYRASTEPLSDYRRPSS